MWSSEQIRQRRERRGLAFHEEDHIEERDTPARWLTKVKDPMSGFFALKKTVIDGVELNPVGYKIGLEILVKGKYSKVSRSLYTSRIGGPAQASSVD